MLPFRRFPRPATARILSLCLLAAPLLTGCVTGTIKQLRADKEMLSARVMQATQDLGAAKEAAERERQRAEAAEGALKKMEIERDAAAGRVSELERRRTAAELALQSTSDSQSREMVRRIEEAMNNEATQRLEVERLRDRLVTVEMGLTEAETGRKTAEEALAAAKARTEEDTKLLEELRQTLEKQIEQISLLSGEKQELTTKLDAANAEIETAKTSAEEATAALEALKTEHATQTAELEKIKAELATQVAALATAEKKITETEAKLPVIPSTDALRDKLTKDLRLWIKPGHVRVTPESGAVRVVFFSDNIFKPASTQLSEEGLKSLAVFAESLSGQAFESLTVEGHTDNIPVRNMPYPDNWELASARANEIVRWLAARPGFDATRLSSASFSFQRPVESNKTSDGRRANRRVEILIRL